MGVSSTPLPQQLSLNQFFSAAERGQGTDKLRGEFTAVLDEVTSLDGFNATKGLELLKPQALAMLKKNPTSKKEK